MGRTTWSYYYPSSDKILYASTHHWLEACPPSPDMYQGYVRALFPTYDIFAADEDGSNLVFASNRNASHPGNTNVFIAEWVDNSRQG